MPHAHSRRPTVCVTCEAEVVGPPVIAVDLPFCCTGCVAGGPCVCSYDGEPGPGDPVAPIAAGEVRYCLDVREMMLAAPSAHPARG